MKTLIALLAAALSVPAFAAEPDRYVVGMLGSAQVDLDKGNADAVLRAAGATNLRSTVEDSASFTKVGIGFRISPRIAAEAAYITTGDFTYRATFTQGSADVDISARGLGVSIVANSKLDDTIAVYGRLGLYHFTVDSRATLRATGVSRASQSGTSMSPEIGAGAEFSTSPIGAVRIEYSFFSQVGEQSTTGKSDVTALSIGFLLRF